MRHGSVLLLLLWLLTGCLGPGVRHVVQPGQTLYRISKTYQVPVDKIMAYNRIKDPARIRSGDALWIPGVTHTRTVSVVPVQKTPAQARPRSVAPSQNTSSVATASVAKKQTTAPAVKPAPSAAPAQKGQLQWPVQGRIVKSFGVQNKIRSKGIVIAAKVGTPVRSAAAGQVIYSGSGIQGYGHLVIIKHARDLYTVYGYNQTNLVKAGSYVNSGQKVALSGVVPSGEYGAVHFEVRQGNKAVNPAFYLP